MRSRRRGPVGRDVGGTEPCNVTMRRVTDTSVDGALAELEEPALDTPLLPRVGKALHQPIFLAMATALVLFLTIILRQPYLVSTHMIAWGDDAVFAIEIDDAKHLRLVDGANSRIGTSHPGPALFYVAAAAEAVLFDGLHAVPEPLNAHRIGYGALASFLFGWAAWLLANRTRPIETIVALAALLCMLTVLPTVLSNSWLPYVYCMPFMLSVIAAGVVIAGDRRGVLPYTVASWLLIHGHVGFLLNVGGMTAFVAVIVLWNHRNEVRAFLRRNRRTAAHASLASAVFLFPMIVNLLVNWPSPWLDYYDYSKTAERDPRALRDVLAFVKYFLTWRGEVSVWLTPIVGALVIGLVAVVQRGDLRRFLTSILVACGAALALFTIYATVGVDHLDEKYTGFYVLMVPATVVAVGMTALCHVAGRHAKSVAVAAAGAIVISATTSNVFVNHDRGDPQVGTLTTALQTSPLREGRTVVLTFEHSTWPWAVGVMQQGSNTGLPVCFADPTWSWFVTERFICSADQLSTGWGLYMWPASEAYRFQDRVAQSPATIVVSQISPS